MFVKLGEVKVARHRASVGKKNSLKSLSASLKMFISMFNTKVLCVCVCVCRVWREQLVVKIGMWVCEKPHTGESREGAEPGAHSGLKKKKMDAWSENDKWAEGLGGKTDGGAEARCRSRGAFV